MLTPALDSILVAFKAKVDKNVNSYCWQDFGSSKSCGWEECQLLLLTGFQLKITVDRDVSSHSWQNFGSYDRQKCQPPLFTSFCGSKSCSYLIGQLMGIRASFWCQVALKATVVNSDNCQRIRVLEVLQQFFVLFSVNSLEHSHYPIISNKPVNL